MPSGTADRDPAAAAAARSGQGGVRLQKVLANAGLGSRRAGEQLIAAGRVSVNGRVVDTLGARVDPESDEVRVDGRLVVTAATLVHLALHKPVGVLSAMSDSRGRPTVGDYVADRPERLFHVGRLDADSEGLLLLTNDGELAHRLAHPSYAVPKTYLAEVTGPLPADLGRRLRAGIELDDGPARVDRFTVVETAGRRVMLEVMLHEGRNRIVRRLLAATGHPVHRLVRTAIGPVRLGGLRPGVLRRLTPEELGGLYAAVQR